LQGLLEEEQVMKEGDKKEYRAWLRKHMAIFRAFVHERELERRQKKRNLEQHPYIAALRVFDELMGQIDSFEKHVQKRLRKIENNWEHFTAFYFVKGAPATNNGVENYYSL
jgi:hypothetical protein